MSRKKVVIIMVSVWAAIVLGAVGFYLIHRHQVSKNEIERNEIVSDMVNSIKLTPEQTFVVDIEELPVEGDEADFLIMEELEPTEPSFSETVIEPSEINSEQSSDQYNLVSYGVISIPAIDLELPVWDKAGKIELRYGVGRMPSGSDEGLFIFGHRMKKYGSMFNRLGEVQIGDSIIISRDSGNITYIVDEIVTINPSELSAYMNINDSSRITLITCTPTGVGSHRLLIIGHAS